MDPAFIPHSRPTLGEEEAKAAAAAVASGQIAEGPEVEAFEREVAGFVGLPHAVAVSSGTAALQLALTAVGAGAGDEVVVPSFVCSALLNAVAAAGAVPVPADVEPETFNLDPADVAGRLSPRTKAIVVPHMFGLPADLDRLAALGVPLIEDCAQAIGAEHRGRAVGSVGQAAIFSFYATKMMATGEGGMVATGSAALAANVRDAKSYDKKHDLRRRFNFKMTDIQAAVGRVQLRRLSEFIRRRCAIAERFRAALQGLPLGLPRPEPGRIYFRFVVDAAADAAALLRQARGRGIGCERPVHTPLHRLLGIEGFPMADAAWRRAVSLPIYPALTDEEAERIIAVVTGLLLRQ
ncbi:MAG: DegT/DnrJ/EryC1/StrS family aminotransferase [Desulfobacterales bacterium]|jgi:dTDP-4-amino-4,6-dideoxygalactose transaminase|nr:DegT/DnrJ/EryC1/StrS family aminotransferase [Desulfobacterales bacterium]